MTETGPDRIRRAIELARGGHAPAFPIQVCGPECRGEVPEPVAVEQDCGRGGGQALERGFNWDGLVCSGCIRLKFSPIHLFYRLIGLCDGHGW